MMEGFIEHYWPEVTEIPGERVREIRRGVSALLVEAGLDVDTSPGSVLGDLHVTPAAWDKAATEIAWSRFTSDLQPENTRKGTTYNCDFVRGYLESFGQDFSAPAAWAILRLTFVNNLPREIDRSTTFLIQNQEFRIRLPFAGPLYLDADPLPGQNHRNLTRLGNNRWAVDLLLQGPPTSDTVEGQTVQVDRTLAHLSSARLLGAVRGGTEPTSLQDMARRLRGINARQPSTRSGVTGMITTRFPEIESVSATLSGDIEQLRDTLNPMLMPGGKVDLHCRGGQSFEDQLFVTLPKVGSSTAYYAGIVSFPDVPVAVNRVLYNGQEVDWQLISIPPDGLPGLSGSFSEREQFFLRVEAAGIPGTLVEAVLTAEFEIQWEMDLALTAVQEWMKDEDNQAVGIDTLVRWFIPYHIKHLDVWYHRKSGVAFNREAARQELLEKFNLHHPGSPAGAHTVGDTMYWAGAHSVQRIELEAELRPSVCSHYLDIPFVMPASDGDWTTFSEALVEIPTRTVTDLINFSPEFLSLDDGVSVGPRNFSWKLPAQNLRLIERGSI